MKAFSQHICRLLKGKWGGFRVLPFGDGLDMGQLFLCRAGRAFNKLISHFHLTIPGLSMPVLVRVAAAGYFSAQQAVYTTGDAALTCAPAPL